MKTIKIILIFLVALLIVFMLVGMYYGAVLFFFVLRLMGIAAVIGFIFYPWYKYRNRTK